MRSLRPAICVLLGCLALPASGFAQPAIPEALEPWRDWVLFGLDHRVCPIRNGSSPGDETSFVCAWPAELAIDVETDGARFEQRWTLYKEDWIPLPGDSRYWPSGVTTDGEPRPVVLRAGRPTVRVPAGEHLVAGQLQWETRPASIPVPAETGLIALSLDGADVATPELDGGVLWLGLRPDLVVEEDRLSVDVYRRLIDSIPIRVETRVQFDVAGQSRELELDGALLPDFIGEALTSELPAELDADGTLRIQVRPGRWVATLTAHHPDIVDTFARAPVVEPWPNDEIWSFQSNPTLRVAALEGAPAVDSQRAGVPPEWSALPSFAVAPDVTLNLDERSRNDAADDNSLSLSRLLWLDFDGNGFTAQDAVQGQMRSEWRLDTAAPYTMTMASIGDENLLVTEGEEAGTQGVELRATNLSLTAVARAPSQATLPVTGYTDTFDRADTVLLLPPAYRLVAAPGADVAAGAWIERWRLLDIFLVLIIAVASWRLLGAVGGAVALATIGLIYHEPWAPHYAWLNLLLIIALLRVVPDGRLRVWCQRYRYLSLAALGLLLIPFVALQLRVVVFPQLEQAMVERGIDVNDDAIFSLGASNADQEQQGQQSVEQITVTGARIRENAFAAPNAASAVTADEMRALGVISAAEMTASLPAGAIGGQLSRYQPGALVQTGPGLPDWAWNLYALGFDGPIDRADTFSLVIFGPWLVGVWRVAGVALALAFAWLLIGRGFDWPRMSRRTGTAAAIALAGVVAAMPRTGEAQAADNFPSAQLLAELRARLTEPAPCHPSCAELTDADIDVGDTTLSVTLEMAVQDAVAVPIPTESEGWRPTSIDVDGTARRTLLRDTAGQAWIRLDAGVRSVGLSGPIPATDSLRLSFPLMPRRIAVESDGWDIAGVAEGRLPSGTLELIRQRDADDDTDDAIQATAFPPFVHVTRTLQFGIDWTATTIVQRIAPRDGAFTIGIDVLPDEAIVTQDIDVDAGVATVAFAAGQNAVRWQSRLPTADTLGITAGDDVPWAETWQFNVGHEWHAEYDGLPSTRSTSIGGRSLITEYLPRPGETLNIALTRPEAVSGDTIAIDDVTYVRSIGARVSDGALNFVYRSTRAVEHPITLPQGSELQWVMIDGVAVPLEIDDTQLTLPVTPGEHRIDIAWRNLDGIGVMSNVTPIDLGAGASNITTRLGIPEDRWVLFTYGPTLGPAVLYWAELAVFIVVAVMLGRIAMSPLRTHEWLLLGLGLSTFSWPVLLLFGVWAFLMSWRGRTSIDGRRFVFNAAQTGLGILTVVTIGALIGSIANGLLGQPNMHIVSPVADGALSWFTDRSDGVTPSAGTISVSLWFYKAAMLAWALWLSFAVLRWLRWAWAAFSFDALWRGKIETQPVTLG